MEILKSRRFTAVPALQMHLRSLTAVMAVFLLLIAFTASAQAAKLGLDLPSKLSSAAPTDTFEVIVSFNGDKVTAENVALLRSLGITRGVTLQALPIAGVIATRAQIEALAARPDVRSIWPNAELQYENNTATAMTGVQKIRTTAAFTARNGGFPFTGRGVSVLINDSGVDGLHPDLEFGPHVIENVEAAANLHAYDTLLPITWVEGVPNTDIGGGHGTHVAGIVGATGKQSGGKYEGVAPGAGIVGYGSGAGLFILDTLGAFDYALVKQTELRIRVINNSWGNTGDVSTDFDPNDPINIATKKCADRNIVVVFSTGNSGPAESTTTGNFKKAPWIIAVANGEKNTKLTSSSSRGERGNSGTVVVDGQTYQWTDTPSVTAPGTDIISTRATTNTVSYVSSNGPTDDVAMIEPAFLPFYVVLSGTSMAAPHVSGVVALMLEANPTLTPAQVKQILRETATNMTGAEAWEVGAGYVNAFAAVDRALQMRNYGKTVNSLRTFNSNVTIESTTENFSIDYNPALPLAPTANQYSFTVPEGLAQVSARVYANGVEGSGNPLDLFLIAPDGTRYESRVPVLFAITPMRNVVVDNPMPGPWKVELTSLTGVGPLDVTTVPENVSGFIRYHRALAPTGLSDIGGHAAEGAIQVAVAERLVDGLPGGIFAPDSPLTRIQMAEYLTMGADIRQFFPVDGSKSFTDVTGTQTAFAEAVATRGAALRDLNYRFNGVMKATGAGTFSPTANVRRVDEAYALVQSLGMEAEALSRNGQQVTVVHQGQRIPVDDAAQIPSGMEGYVQLALDLNLMNAYFTLTQGPFDLQPTIHATFKPTQTVTRGAFAVDMTRFLAAY